MRSPSRLLLLAWALGTTGATAMWGAPSALDVLRLSTDVAIARQETLRVAARVAILRRDWTEIAPGSAGQMLVARRTLGVVSPTELRLDVRQGAGGRLLLPSAPTGARQIDQTKVAAAAGRVRSVIVAPATGTLKTSARSSEVKARPTAPVAGMKAKAPADWWPE